MQSLWVNLHGGHEKTARALRPAYEPVVSGGEGRGGRKPKLKVTNCSIDGLEIGVAGDPPDRSIPGAVGDS